MLYLVFAIFSLGTGMLQSSFMRATKGTVASRRRYTYAVLAALATAIEVLVGAIAILPNSALFGALLCFPIFYVVHTTAMKVSLRLRYTFRIGLALVLLGVVPLYFQMKPFLQSNSSADAPTWAAPADAPPAQPSEPGPPTN